MSRLEQDVVEYLWVLGFILSISRKYRNLFILEPVHGKWTSPAILIVYTAFQTQGHPIVQSPGNARLDGGVVGYLLVLAFIVAIKRQYPNRFVVASVLAKWIIPAILTVSTPFQTQVHSIVATPGNASLSAGCCQVPVGTSFDSSNNPSISKSICTLGISFNSRYQS